MRARALPLAFCFSGVAERGTPPAPTPLPLMPGLHCQPGRGGGGVWGEGWSRACGLLSCADGRAADKKEKKHTPSLSPM